MDIRRLVALPLLAGLALSACDRPKLRGHAAPPRAAADPAGTPAPPAWARGVMGKPLRAAFPRTGTCVGNADIVAKTYSGQPAGVRLHGWGWDQARNVRIGRVVLVDKAFRIVGAGEGGVPRPDVPTAKPFVTDPDTGWNADAAVTAGPLEAYGVVGDGGAVCGLGRLAL